MMTKLYAMREIANRCKEISEFLEYSDLVFEIPFEYQDFVKKFFDNEACEWFHENKNTCINLKVGKDNKNKLFLSIMPFAFTRPNRFNVNNYVTTSELKFQLLLNKLPQKLQRAIEHHRTSACDDEFLAEVLKNI